MYNKIYSNRIEKEDFLKLEEYLHSNFKIIKKINSWVHKGNEKYISITTIFYIEENIILRTMSNDRESSWHFFKQLNRLNVLGCFHAAICPMTLERVISEIKNIKTKNKILFNLDLFVFH